MPLVSACSLLTLALLSSPVEASPSPFAACETASPQVALTPESTSNPPVVCVSRKLTTNLLFDSKLSSVKLKDRGRFLRVLEGPDALLLEPPDDLVFGEVLPLSVCFADDAAPACVTFHLVGHPALAMQQVNVTRQPRTVAYYEEKAERAEARAQRLELELQQLRAARGVPDGLRGVWASGLLGTEGILSKPLERKANSDKTSTPSVARITSYRANGRVAVEMSLTNFGTTSWTASGAVLRGPKGEIMNPLPLWPTEPIPPRHAEDPSEPPGVMVEFLAAWDEARGTYTLTIWDVDRLRTVTVGNVTFP
jgi:uncharacterized protein (TIGR02268 family)